MGQPSDPNTVSGWVNDAISSGVGSVGDFLQDKVGGMVGSAAQGGLSALGIGGAVAGDTLLGTAAGNTAMQWGTGGLDAALGGTSVSYGGGTAGAEIAAAQQAGASAAATTGFASWASTAAIGLVLLWPLGRL